MKIAQERLFVIVFVISCSTDYDIIRNIIVFGMISIAQERLKLPSYMISYAISGMISRNTDIMDKFIGYVYDVIGNTV